MSAIQESIEGSLEVKWEEFMRKTIAMGSEGASVAVGPEIGVITMLQKYSPWLGGDHCYGHRLELALRMLSRKCYSLKG